MAIDNTPLPDDDTVHAAYRELEQPTPPAALDAAILAAARQAATPPRATLTVLPTRRRWVLPLSIAATIVLSVGMVAEMMQGKQEAQQASLAPAPAQQEAAPAGVAAAPARVAEPAPLADQAVTAASRSATVPSAVQQAPRMAARQAAPAAPERQTELTKPSPPPAAEARPANDANMAPAPAVAPAITPSQAPPPAAPAVDRLAAPMQKRLMAVPPAATGRATSAESNEVPELQAIRRLLQQGDLAGARAALKRYREQHPEAALPDDLRDKLADAPSP